MKEEIQEYEVARVCAWCNKYMGLADFKSCKSGQVTHGMCDECFKKERGQSDERR